MSVKLKPYNPLDYFNSAEEINDYLRECFEDEDSKTFIVALGHVAKNKGIAMIAEETGLSRESIYKTLSGKTQSKWDTIRRIVRALNIPLNIAA